MLVIWDMLTLLQSGNVIFWWWLQHSSRCFWPPSYWIHMNLQAFCTLKQDCRQQWRDPTLESPELHKSLIIFAAIIEGNVCLSENKVPQIHWFIISFLMTSATSLGKSHVMKPVKVMVHCRSWKCSRPFGEAVARCSAPVAMLRFPALNSKISMPMSRSKRWRTSNLDQIKPHMAQSKIWILTTNVFVIWNLISKHHGF